MQASSRDGFQGNHRESLWALSDFQWKVNPKKNGRSVEIIKMEPSPSFSTSSSEISFQLFALYSRRDTAGGEFEKGTKSISHQVLVNWSCQGSNQLSLAHRTRQIFLSNPICCPHCQDLHEVINILENPPNWASPTLRLQEDANPPSPGRSGRFGRS